MRIAIVTIVILFAVCRYMIGYDYDTYYNIIKDEDVALVELLFSPLSALIAKTAIYFHSPQLLFIIFGVPTYILIFAALKRYSFNYSFSVIIFLCLFFYTSLSIIRQALAVAICFYGYRFVIDRKLIKYIIIVAIATLFHYSAVVALVIYWMPSFRFRTLVIIMGVAIIVKPVIFNLLEQSGFYSSYLERNDLEGGTLTRLLNYFLLCSCLFFWKNSRYKNTINDGMINILFTGISMYLIFDAHIGARVGLYFNIFICLLLPNVLNFIVKSRKEYTIFYYMLFIFYFFTYLWIPVIKNIPSSYIPYRVFFLQ